MSDYIDSRDQLVVELYVRNMKESSAFYQALGFQVIREEEDFMELQWESAWIMLDASRDTVPPSPVQHPVGNIRVMVPNVDDYWSLAKKMGARVIRPIENREYGLRDFTIAGPDGLGLRFATRL
jgi:catechol 2,3-dioxygenase-like lactoylglutathione lyase family enzyme